MSIFTTTHGIVRPDCLSFILDEDMAERDSIAWRVESAVTDPANPLIAPHYPWDSGTTFGNGTFLIDPIDGLWKGWFICTPAGVEKHEDVRRMTYATSADGVNWTRPMLDVCPQPNHPLSNVLMDYDSGGITQNANVTIWPDAELDRRYEMFCLRDPSRPASAGQRHVRGIEPRPGEAKHPFASYRYFSADGLHWNAVEGPLLETQTVGCKMTLPYTKQNAGADNALYYANRTLGIDDSGYLLYQKVGEVLHPGGIVPHDVFPWGRRVIARRTSTDGSDWSDLEVIIQPDWRDPHDQQFMILVPHKVHGGYLGLLACYNVRQHTIDWQWAGSPDLRLWYRPARQPTLPVAPLGDYGGGMLWPTYRFIEHDGRTHMYYAGLEGLHGDIAFGAGPNILDFHGAICRASWAMDRYWAAVSAAGGPSESSFRSHAVPAAGKRLLLNAATSTVTPGELAVELTDPDGTPIEGFTRADYVPWHGDSTAQPARWASGEVCPRATAAARFFLQRVRLYGFAWR